MIIFTKPKSKVNLFSITIVNIKITFSSTKYRKGVKNFLQENFCLINWDLKTIFYLFPFFFGFSQMILSRYKDQTFSSFFEKTLPRKQILKEEMSWETFEFIKAKSLNVNQIEKIHLYSDSFVVFFKQNNEKVFIGFFINKENETKHKNISTTYKLILTDVIGFFENDNFSKNFIFNEIFYNLDELPIKIDEITNQKLRKKSFFDFELKTLKNENFNIQTKNLSIPRNKKFILFTKNLKKENSLLPKITFGISSSIINSNKYISNKIENSDLKTITQTELNDNLDLKTITQTEFDSFFCNYNVQPPTHLIKRSSLKELIQPYIDYYEGFVPQSYIHFLRKLKKREDAGLGNKNSFKDLIQAHIDRYEDFVPDYVIQDLKKLKKQEDARLRRKYPYLTKKNKKLAKQISKLQLQKQTLNILNDYLPIRTNKLVLPRKFSGYSYPDLNVKSVYSLVFNLFLNSIKNIISLKINLPPSFLSFLDESHSILEIRSRKDGFFGLNAKKAKKNNDYFFGLNPKKVKKKKKNTKLKWKTFMFTKNKTFMFTKNKTFIFHKNFRIFKNKKSIFDYDDYQPGTSFFFYKRGAENQAVNFEKNKIDQLIGKNETNPSTFSKNILYNNQNLDYQYNLFTENLVNLNSNNMLHFGEVYKNLSSLSIALQDQKLYRQRSRYRYFQSWEPISNHSWMIVMQFSTFLFLCRLVLDLYKDYGRELVHYLLESASSSGVDIEAVKEQYLYDDPEFRLINKVNKSFDDVAGIDKIIPELGEIVWFLRNRGRSSKFKNSIPKGILLTGPPGTGKTLLVQALAGEAQVPVIVESGILLTDPQQKGRGLDKLKKIFDRARQLAPCIVFIDEVDTIGEKRQNIIQTAMGEDGIIESIYEKKPLDDDNNFIPQPLNLNEDQKPEKDLDYVLYRGDSQNQQNNILAQFQKKMEIKKIRFSILTQFLIEMDGLKERQGVIVIGATNRPNVLDPALIRPGRFDQILNLQLPGKTKRIEILKFYSKKVQIDKKVSWEYLANRTQGFSAADLAVAMNESAIQSILNQTKHTIETIERGIDLVTSYSNDNVNFINKKNPPSDPFFISRLAYYQSGKATLQTLLPNHQPVVFLHLWPRQKNARHINFYKKFIIGNKTRFDLETQLIGLYSGKAAELLNLCGFKFIKAVKKWQSNLGIEDLLSATFLAKLMVDNSFLYSNKVSIRKFSTILNNRNIEEFKEPEKLELLLPFDNQIDDEIEIEQIAKIVRNTDYEQHGFAPWWQIQVSKQISQLETFFVEWYRIYLPDPEERILNIDWIPPDQFYHTNEPLKKMSQKSDPSINDLYKIERDYIYHGLILNAFNKAFSDLNNMREFLDYFADYLIRYEILREDQIFYILRIKNLSKHFYNQDSLSNLGSKIIQKDQKESSKQKIITKGWGNKSRRKNYRFINFDSLNFLKDFTRDQSSTLKDNADS